MEKVRHKRTPQRPPTLENDFYISKKTKCKPTVDRALRLLSSHKHKNIVLHGLGKMISKTIQIALMIQKLENVQIACDSRTVECIDDVLENVVVTETRLNSCLEIRIEKIKK